MRSTTVLTKNPTSSSRASSVRPAMGEPMGMSVPAPNLVSRVANPACSTMNRVAPLVRANSANVPCSRSSMDCHTVSPRWLATGGRGRSVGSARHSGMPASCSVQKASCRDTRLCGSGVSPSSSRCQKV